MLIQLDFFKSNEESWQEALEARMDKCEASATKVRKGQFAHIGELKKMYNDMNDRIQIIERNICRGK